MTKVTFLLALTHEFIVNLVMPLIGVVWNVDIRRIRSNCIPYM